MTSARAALPPTLLLTKLFVPLVRDGAVVRPRLHRKLDRVIQARLTLIAAPAGFGKSTLVSTWHAAAGSDAIPMGWVSLDPADDDPLRFWSYLLAALERLVPGLAAPALAALQSPQPPPMEHLLTSVLNAVALHHGPPSDIALVLDDVHVITNPVIHATLGWFVEHLPPRLHLVMLTRADPALPLGRLRASGQLVELRAEDLRFTTDEAESLLVRTEGLALSDDEIGALTRRTEGWIAGLQLASLALRDRGDPDAFIATFSGSDRFVMDYLVTEVLARQADERVAFLVRTSILDRLTGELCDAVLDQVDAAAPGSSARILEALERANLFLVPLDEKRGWYRYHHLFADVLRQRLGETLEAAEIADLHARASEWFEAHGLGSEAIEHALAAEDWPRVVRLLERDGLRSVVAGQVRTVLGWLAQVPDDRLRHRPRLCIIEALARLFANDLATALARVTDAERRVSDDTPPDEAATTRGLVAAMRANIAQYTGDIAACVAFGEQVLALLPEPEVIARTTATLHVAKAFRVTGDVSAAAERQAVAAVAPIRASGSLLGSISAIANIARLQRLQGRLRAAAATYREMLELPAAGGSLQGLHGSLAFYAGMGDLHREWNELDTADELLTEAALIMPDRLTADADDIMVGHLAIAGVQRARGDLTGARATLDRLVGEAQRRGFVAILVARIAAERARLSLAAGDLAAATRWADTSGLRIEHPADFLREAELLVLARVAIVRTDRSSARSGIPAVVRLLDRVGDDAMASGRGATVIEALVVRALAFHALADRVAAVEALATALALAEPEGYVRRFLDEGPPMEALLRLTRERGVAAASVDRILAGQASPTARVSARPGVTVPSGQVGPETLSARELEVLRLMGTGRSNAEIALVMTVAVSTAKTHVNNVFAKLAVSSRGEALDRARELRLL